MAKDPKGDLKGDRNRITLTLNLEGLRDRLERQAREPGQSLSSIVRMATFLGLELLEELERRGVTAPPLGKISQFLDTLKPLPAAKQPESIAEIVRENREVLQQRMKSERVDELVEGNFPSDVDLVRIAYILDIDEEFLHQLRKQQGNGNGHEHETPALS